MSCSCCGQPIPSPSCWFGFGIYARLSEDISEQWMNCVWLVSRGAAAGARPDVEQ